MEGIGRAEQRRNLALRSSWILEEDDGFANGSCFVSWVGIVLCAVFGLVGACLSEALVEGVHCHWTALVDNRLSH